MGLDVHARENAASRALRSFLPQVFRKGARSTALEWLPTPQECPDPRAEALLFISPWKLGGGSELNCWHLEALWAGKVGFVRVIEQNRGSALGSSKCSARGLISDR